MYNNIIKPYSWDGYSFFISITWKIYESSIKISYENKSNIISCVFTKIKIWKCHKVFNINKPKLNDHWQNIKKVTNLVIYNLSLCSCNVYLYYTTTLYIIS